MHKLNISKRYGGLFEVLISRVDNYGESLIFPANGLPFVFRTDASARAVAKRLVSNLDQSKDLRKDVALVVDGYCIAELPKDLALDVIQIWHNQSVCLGSLEITEINKAPELNLALQEKLLRLIYSQAVRC